MAKLKSKAFSFLLILFHIIPSFLLADSRCTLERKYNNTVMETRFKSWLERHNKNYQSREEWMLRFGIYQANLNFINFINSQNLTYKLGDNEFADLTNDEFKSLYVGRLIFPPSRNHYNHSSTTTPKTHKLQAPASIDWREKGAVTDVKFQGTCEACWSFSATGAVEGIIQITTGNLVALSEQELIDCDTASTNKGCSGGYKDVAFQYIQSNGISAEAHYPYTDKQGECRAPTQKAAKISGFNTVTPNSEASLLEAVALQPVSVSVESGGNDFQLYSSGIFQGNCGTKLDHDLIIVGYGEESGQKYWIMKNSWGENWGEAGYMRILRDAAQPEGTCGLAMSPSFPVA